MSGTDELAAALRSAAAGADPGLTGDLVRAAYRDKAGDELEAIATTALSAGVASEDILRACDAARLHIRTEAGAERNYADPAEDVVLELMDRLVGWCGPAAKLPRETEFGGGA